MLTFPTTGAGPKEWTLAEDQIAAWQALYPQLDVLQQCRMAKAWIDVNHKKTAKGMPRFLVNWLNRAVARGEVVTTPAQKPDIRGHYPPCRSNTECLRKVLSA